MEFSMIGERLPTPPPNGQPRRRCRHFRRRAVNGGRGLCRPCYDDPAVRGLYPDGRPAPLTGGRPVCRHCHARAASRSRGLCWPCFYTPGVRDCYPVGSVNPATAKYVPHSLRDDAPAEADLAAAIAELRRARRAAG